MQYQYLLARFVEIVYIHVDMYDTLYRMEGDQKQTTGSQHVPVPDQHTGGRRVRAPSGPHHRGGHCRGRPPESEGPPRDLL